jgi:hypothetical protein
MGRESQPRPNGMLIIWPSSVSANAVALRLSANPLHAIQEFHPWFKCYCSAVKAAAWALLISIF